MFLKLAHTRLDVFVVSKEFVLACYKATKVLPAEEKFAMIQQIRRAALSVHLNIAEGCSRESLAERNRFYEVARGSIIEIDAALDVAAGLGYTSEKNLSDLGPLLIRSFQLTSKMIR
jgi:four helix bundle protein